jgi:hypothetical protein
MLHGKGENAAERRRRSERKLHEGNLKLAMRIMETQAQMIEDLEAKIEMEQKKTEEAENARIRQHLREVRSYHGKRPEVSS